MNLNGAVNSLQVYLKNDGIKQINAHRYFVNSGLVFISNEDGFPINLVEFSGRLYFADYGISAEAVEYSNFSQEIKDYFANFIKKTNIVFEDDTLLLPTSEESIIEDFNIFVMAIMQMQALSL